MNVKFKKVLIAALKKRLKFAYLQWNREADSYSCGISIARVINPRISHLEYKMPRLARQLRDLGDDCPFVPGEADFR